MALGSVLESVKSEDTGSAQFVWLLDGIVGLESNLEHV